MGRRRSYERDAVVRAARDLFWERGYELTSVDHVERRTGLNRSSLYQAFGSKRGLFNAALDRYIDEVTGELLSGLTKTGGGTTAVVEFFRRLARSFRADPAGAARGCLLVNSIAELGGRDPDVARVAAAHRDRLREAFAVALGAGANGSPPELIAKRAKLLAATAMGAFLTARLDPGDAADLCDAVADEVSTWASPAPVHRTGRPKAHR
jgi:TetR/AcrR family transcriptional regulator, transcriptional repressor for nem operon